MRRHRNINAISDYLSSKTYTLLKHQRDIKNIRELLQYEGGAELKSRCFERLVLINNDILDYCKRD